VLSAQPASPAEQRESETKSTEERIQALEKALREQREEYERRLRELESASANPAAPAEPSTDRAQPSAASEPSEAAPVSSLSGPVSGTPNEAEDAQLKALLESHEEELPVDLNAPTVKLYGFMDMGLQRAWGGLYNSGIPETGETTFVLGNVNTYIDAQPHPDWRALTEVRFTLFPNGATNIGHIGRGDFTLADTSVFDDTGTNGGFTEVQWSGIVLERAHIDYMASDLVNLRVGYFLTPYGIWNVDHGTPTRMTLWEPIFMALEIIPKRQLGVQLFGREHFLPWELHYNAYVSNGRTEGQVDYTDDKALGGRVALKRHRPYPFQLGLSFHIGGSEAELREAGVATDGTLGITRRTVAAYDEYAGAADVSLDVGAFRVRSEAVVRVRLFEEGKRNRNLDGAFNADQTVTAGYVALGYRLPFDVEPLLAGEFIRQPNILGEAFMSAGPGLNYYPSPSAVLKLSYSYIRGFDFGGYAEDLERVKYHFLGGRLAIAY
jgi:hypothetical protein